MYLCSQGTQLNSLFILAPQFVVIHSPVAKVLVKGYVWWFPFQMTVVFSLSSGCGDYLPPPLISPPPPTYSTGPARVPRLHAISVGRVRSELRRVRCPGPG